MNAETAVSLRQHGRSTDSTRTVLIVEDEILIRIPIAQYLRDCGYKVIEAANADEAMVVLTHRETVVDIVFSDIEMPGSVDGFGLAKWIRENRLRYECDLGRHRSALSQCGEPYEAHVVHDHIRRLLAARSASKKS